MTPKQKLAQAIQGVLAGNADSTQAEVVQTLILRAMDGYEVKTNSKNTSGGKVGSRAIINRLEKSVRYYEQMRRDARSAIDIAGRMSLEMKNRVIEAREKLERAKQVNSISMTKKRNEKHDTQTKTDSGDSRPHQAL